MKKKLLKTAMGMAMSEVKLGRKISERAGRRAGRWVMRRVAPERHEPAGVTAAKGLGAAAVAIPIGFWLGRRFLTPAQQRHA